MNTTGLRDRGTETDVLVVGGGVLGAAAVYQLASRGIAAVLVEQTGINGAASGANAGTLHVQIPPFHFAAFPAPPPGTASGEMFRATNRLFAAAAAAWRTLETELAADLGVRIGGGLMVAETDAQLRLLDAKAAYERREGLAVEVLTAADLRAVAPMLAPTLAGASWCPAEGFANPLLVAPAYARRAAELGAEVQTRCRVTAIERDHRGRFRVETTIGEMAARRVVLAAGAATPQLAASLGLAVPVRAFPLQVLVTAPWPPLLRQLVQHVDRHLSLRQTPYGTFVVGGGWPGGVGKGLALDSVSGNLAVARDVLPAIGQARLRRAWTALTTGVGRANRVGVIGECRRVAGVYLLVAGGWGFSLAPVLGRLMAELIADGTTNLPIAPFAPDGPLVFADSVT